MRAEILTKLNSLRYSAEETHRINWELKKRSDEVQELNGTLQQLQQDLMQEREQFHRLSEEHGQLSNLKAQNEKKLSQLTQ